MSTKTPASLTRLLRSLEDADCQPWRAGDGHWYAACPACREEGRHGIVEIRATTIGVIVACSDAHERREAAA